MVGKKLLVPLVAIAVIASLTGGYYYFSHDLAPNTVPQSGLGVNLASVTHNEALSQMVSEAVWVGQNNFSINENQIMNLIMQHFYTLQNNETFQHYLKTGGPLSYSLGLSFNFNQSRYNASNHYGMDFTFAYYQFVYKVTNNTGVQVWWALNIGENALTGPVIQYSDNY